MAELRSQNSALRATAAPHSGSAVGTADSSSLALRTCEHEVARLRQELAAVKEDMRAALLVADAEHCMQL